MRWRPITTVADPPVALDQLSGSFPTSRPGSFLASVEARVGERGRGDHVVQFKVDIPRKLTPRQEDLMRELATELGE